MLAEDAGVDRIEGRTAAGRRDRENGDLTGVVLDDGREVNGDFFLDCSGFRALLLGETLGVAFED